MSTFLAFLYAAVLSGVPLLYGTLGEIITEKAGHQMCIRDSDNTPQ